MKSDRLSYACTGCLALALLLAGPANAQSVPVFVEVADGVALDFRHFNGAAGGYHLPEIMGSGAAFFDYDNDGDLDVFLVQGSVLAPGTDPAGTTFPWRGTAPRGRLFRNDLPAGATAGLTFTDVTAASGIVADGYGMGVATGDFDNDGWTDLYLANLGANRLLRNDGDGTFTDVTAGTGTDDARWSTSATFFDYDRDGWLDLFVAHYVDFSLATSPACYARTTRRDYCGPQAFRPVHDRLFHNRGDGTFEDVTAASGIGAGLGSGLGVVAGDLNGDGWTDLYVANDGNPNHLWRNRGDGTFVDEAVLAGAAVNRHGKAEAGMGVDAGDFDGDGDDDVFLTHLMDETHTLYVNQDNLYFEDRTYESQLAAQGRRYTGFGTRWFDYDGDGWLDLLVTNGAVRILLEQADAKDPFPFKQPNQLFRNTGTGRFVDASAEAGAAFGEAAVGRGAAFGDVDNDGDTDVLVSNNNGPARLFLNQAGNRNHWLGLRLVGGAARHDRVGTRVAVVTTQGKTLWRRVRTDGGYLSAHDPRVLAGLGREDRVAQVRVYWPSGRQETWENLPLDRYVTLREGTAPRTRRTR